MTSKSRSNVDTPRDTSQRHSMFVSHSELAHSGGEGSKSSSATLPSAAGSVDRLTGLEEKKPSRFFTLKPKTSFSFRPFFKSSSSSLVSLSSPGKRRKHALERRDSYVQTEQESRPEVGVQTLNASTVDVPVQTCSETWDEGDSYGHRRLAYAPARASPFWSRPYGVSSGLSNSLTAKNAPKDSLASSKLVKCAAPANSTKTAAVSYPSPLSPPSGNSCQSVSPPPHSLAPDSTNVTVKYFSAKELNSNAFSLALDPQKPPNANVSVTNGTYDNLGSTSLNLDAGVEDGGRNLDSPSLNPNSSADDSSKNSCSIPLDVGASVKERDENLCRSDTPSLIAENTPDNIKEVSNNLKYPQSSENILPALKIERIDSPSRRLKSVHFDLPGSRSPKISDDNSLKPRNIDKDFEALLKDLNVWTDEDAGDLKVTFDSVPLPNKCPAPTLISPNLKSAIDVLKQDFLAPIPETANEYNETEENGECKNSSIANLNKDSETKIEGKAVNKNKNTDPSDETGHTNETIALNKEVASPIPETSRSKIPLTRSISEYDNEITVEVSKNDSATAASKPSANSAPNAETDSLEGNVYDNVIKEENPVKTVPLPTLPSFFEPPSQIRFLETTAIIESGKEDGFDAGKQTEMPFETDFERSRLSRSSSRSSARSSTKNEFDAIHAPCSRFDSCENLDQLEEEIIRSLYSPDEGELKENIMDTIELPLSETFQNSGTAATHMRRVILDQLLSGKSVSDIVPNYTAYQRAQSVPESTAKYKPPKKYTAVITRMENDALENNPASNYTPGIMHNFEKCSDAEMEFTDQEITAKTSDVKHTRIGSPKKTSVFLFPEDEALDCGGFAKSAVEISASPSRGPSVLEVRRSSWTPQSTGDSTTGGSSFVRNPVASEDKMSPGPCDFTNCLRPSKIQHSPFLTKINARSMSPCNFSHLPPIQSHSSVPDSSTSKHSESPVKPLEAVGECDFASCLKPSEVQNSLFTAELSEITANKSTNSLRAGNLSTIRMNSPLPTRSGNWECPSSSPPAPEKNQDVVEPVRHKSELLITLQSNPKHSSDLNGNTANTQSGVKDGAKILPPEETFNQDLNKQPDVVPETEISESAKPPPPPPPPPLASSQMPPYKENDSPMESLIKAQRCNLITTEVPDTIESRCMAPSPKTPVIAELEKRFQNRNYYSQELDGNIGDKYSAPVADHSDLSDVGKYENLNGSSNHSNGIQFQNGGVEILSEPREQSSSVYNSKSDSNSLHTAKLTFSPNTIITDEPPPPGAVLLDKKVTVDGDKIHTDKFFAIPVKEVLKEKTSTTKFIPAPPKYEGIGPTEDGIPIGLRNSVKKENMHNWYKTMFKSLHKADSSNDSQEYIIGYTSEPETSKRDVMMRKKSSTLDNRLKQDVNSNFKQNHIPSAKSSIEVYNVHPRLIEDYEPGHSSVTDDEIITSRRYLPSLKAPKPSYVFKNGYESDTTVTKKRNQPETLTPEQQKMWYREVQKGGDIPQFGLGKPVPEKPKGPIPPPPANYSGQPSYQQAVRPLTLPADYSNQNGNGYCQQMNGSYEMQMRHAIHSEMQQRRSPNYNQLSPPIRTIVKSPSRSPDMKIPAQALFDFKAESPKEIPLKKGDMVLILRQLDKNWYEGECRGIVGIFPMSYVEIVPPEHMSTPVKPKPEGLGRALYDFDAQTSIEITVRKGDTITLLRRVDANWFEAIFKNKKGIIPISYIQVLQEPAERNVKSPSPRSYTASPSSESKEKIKPNSLSPSAYSSSSASPLPALQAKRKLLNKKGSNLIEPVMYRALYSYTPQNTDELELLEGDSVYVVEMCDDGWYVGTSVRTGVFGIFPGNYVEKTC